MKYIVLFFITVLATSCISIQNLVEAEALGKGNKSLQFNSELAIFPQGGNEPAGFWPTLGVQAGFGVTSNLDFRAELTTNRALRIQGKIQVIDNEKIDFAIGGTADLDMFLGRAIHPSFDLYSTYHYKNTSIMFNPSVRLSTNVYFTTGDLDGFVYSTTIGIKNNYFERLKFGINLAFAPNAEFSPFFGLGCAYEIRQNKM